MPSVDVDICGPSLLYTLTSEAAKILIDGVSGAIVSIQVFLQVFAWGSESGSADALQLLAHTYRFSTSAKKS